MSEAAQIPQMMNATKESPNNEAWNQVSNLNQANEVPDDEESKNIMKMMSQRGRRTSVSAESMKPTRASSVTSSAAASGNKFAQQGGILSATIEEFTPPNYPKSASQHQRLMSLLKSSSNFLFSHLDDSQFKQLVDSMKEVLVKSGEIVIKQGDVGDYFYVVDEGNLDVYLDANNAVSSLASPMSPARSESEDKEFEIPASAKKVHQYESGGSFGELALMYNSPRAATIKATTDGKLWSLDRQSFRHILMETTNTRRKMYERFLEEVPVLGGLTKTERYKIADCLESVSFAPGDVVVKQGEEGFIFYLVEEGKAEVTQIDDKGEKRVLLELGKGQYFGELALLSSKPRAATITAIEPLKCATLHKDAFDRLVGGTESLLNELKKNAVAYGKVSRRKSIREVLTKLENDISDK